MIILDTNVVSELMRSPAAGKVAQWFEGKPLASLATTAITIAEILHGIRLLAEGRRRAELEHQLRAFFDRGFHDRIIAFDAAAAEAYSSVAVVRRRGGNPISQLDAMIAGIALSCGADIATRDVAGFEGRGLRIINPWNE